MKRLNTKTVIAGIGLYFLLCALIAGAGYFGYQLIEYLFS